jgi:microcompartment protein CcmK/EutM
MMLCRIDGNLTSTVKHKSAAGCRLLICQPITADGAESGPLTVAVDPLGAALHQRVIVNTDGRYMGALLNDERTPLSFCVVGILDK